MRVTNNVDLDPNNYAGDKDMSRMRQSMVARKADITKVGGIDNIWNMTRTLNDSEIPLSYRTYLNRLLTFLKHEFSK